MADEPKKSPRKSAAAKKGWKKLGPTTKQRKLVKELAKGKTPTEAVVAAGYSPKNPSQTVYQAMQGIRLRVPEMLDKAGYSVPAIIEKHLAPKLKAKETKFFAHEGKVISTRKVDDHGTQMRAIENMLEMHGAYAPKDPAEAAQFGVKVIIVDVPRPKYDVPDLRPGDDPKKILDVIEKAQSNGHKTQE